MSKNKKRKTRKQKIASNRPATIKKSVLDKSVVKKSSVPVSEDNSKKPAVSETELQRNNYIKLDVIKSATLTALILLAFALIFVVLDRTNAWTNIYSVFNK